MRNMQICPGWVSFTPVKVEDSEFSQHCVKDRDVMGEKAVLEAKGEEICFCDIMFGKVTNSDWCAPVLFMPCLDA